MNAHLAEWRQQIEVVTVPPGDKLARFALEFLATEHAQRAVELGWSTLELFGMHHGELKFAVVRGDTQGLVPSMTLSNAHTYTIVAIEPDRAVLQTNGGATLMHRRRLSEERPAIPFWERPAFRGPTRYAGLHGFAGRCALAWRPLSPHCGRTGLCCS